ncbi:hypothetical protein QWM81_23340 [Streptomyces ficellus]|uniref:DUF2613 family protein n=1 Tax=Streptomyces ficellus TaxID=1977088 RepID=A0ABT7ZBW3_9ACTN|nr:hypothetical protein [Streptomyces ficellus]MDN3296926.1 hypothetical protein [Streptomyces ficellus]
MERSAAVAAIAAIATAMAAVALYFGITVPALGTEPAEQVVLASVVKDQLMW